MSDRSYSTSLRPSSDANEYNRLSFVINQIMGRIATSTLVKVIAVSNSGGVSAVGTVDVQPMINQVDGELKGTPHGIIYGVPYVRLQGGAAAVILDPVVGDIGWCGFCSTDISVVKSTKAQATPGSRRRYDWADGLYLGGVLGAAPTTYLQFNSDGVTILAASGTKVTVQADHVNVISDDVNLGAASGGKKVVLDGDAVVSGHVVATSTKVKAT